MFAGVSGPPQASGTTWSMMKPGQAPLGFPVDGQCAARATAVCEDSAGVASIHRFKFSVISLLAEFIEPLLIHKWLTIWGLTG